MTTTTFTPGTVVASAWLNDVDEFVYQYPVSGNCKNAAKYYTNDMGAALQAAHDALGPDGGTIIIPGASGYYGWTTTAAFTKPIRLVGEGWFSSEFYSTTSGLIYITTTSKLVASNLHFSSYGGARGNSVAIKTLASATSHTMTKLENCYFDGQSRCYWSERTTNLIVNNCLFGAIAGFCLYLENQTNSDEGDSFLTNNGFSGDSNSICVYAPSTAEIKFTGNKFLNPTIGHVLIETTSGAVGNYLFTNNSFEGQAGYGIKIRGTSGVITKTLITGNQFSSTCSAHIIVGANSYNTTITGNTFNASADTEGTGITIEAGSFNTTIVGNAFHQILEAVTVESNTSVGLTMASNRFAQDVSTFCVGDDGITNYPPQKEISISRYITNASNSAYVDAFKVIGYGTLEIKIYGLVQGVGACNYYRKVLLSDNAAIDIDTAVTSGAAFDVQVATSGSYLTIGVKRNGATGTALTLYVEVTARGQITDFRKA